MSSSASNSPHRFTGSIDAFYDPDFTADISKKMRVPERIIVDDKDMNGQSICHFDDPAIISAKKQTKGGSDRPVLMTVPERILVTGNETHMSGREPLPELKLENSLIGMSGDYSSSDNNPVQLSTPPHTLTLNEHTFPTVDDNRQTSLASNGAPPKTWNVNKRKRNVALSGFTNASVEEDLIVLRNSGNESIESPEYQSYYNSNISVNDMSDESHVLRRQVKALSRRVAAIEVENQHRHQREVFVYTIGVIYFLIKGIFWIQKKI